jgi:cell shape-determining protein MreC
MGTYVTFLNLRKYIKLFCYVVVDEFAHHKINLEPIMKENREEFKAHIKRKIHLTIEEEELQNEREQLPTILMDNKIQVEEPMINA